MAWFDKSPCWDQREARNWKSLWNFYRWEDRIYAFDGNSSSYSISFWRKRIFFVGNFSAYFNITKFEVESSSKSITLETDSYFFLLSSISITFHDFGESSAMQIHHRFNIKSMLFHNTIGIALRMFLENRLTRALENLKIILCKLQNERFLQYWI